MSNEIQERIMTNLANIEESGFFSKNIQDTLDSFENVKTFKDLVEVSTFEYSNNLDNVVNHGMLNEFKKYSKVLEKTKRLENTFSFEVDFI